MSCQLRYAEHEAYPEKLANPAIAGGCSECDDVKIYPELLIGLCTVRLLQ
jgi:hypothetical protein